MEKLCTRCESTFNPQKAEFHCPTGQPHLLEIKTYYLDDAPADPGPFTMTAYGPVATGDNRRHSQTILCNVIPEKTIIRDGSPQIVPGKNVTFIRGMYATDLAEEQFYLDIRERDGALCDKARWEAVYLTDHQRLELREMAFAAEKQQLVEDRSSLLASVKKQGLKDQIPA